MLTLHIEFPLTGAETSALRAMLDTLQGAGVGQTPFPPLTPANAPSTAGALPSLIAPVVSQAGAVGTYPNAASAPAPTPGQEVSAGAPVTGVTYPVTNPAGIAVDVRGMPWDERIHSSNKQCGANGKWMKRRGMNDEGLTRKIEDELLATMAIPVTPVTNAAAAMAGPAPTLPPGATPLPDPSSMASTPPVLPAGAQPLTGAGPNAATPGPAATFPPAAPTDLSGFMQRTSAGIAAGILTQDDIATCLAAFNIPNAYGFVKRPELVPQVWAALQSNFPAL